jgi:NADH-quinone oxidoreductase subunit J
VNFLFYLFSSLALISAVFVTQAKNPVHSVLFLILVFFNASGLLILMGLDFIALILMIVYVGAITTLFLFVVMLLDIKTEEVSEKRLRYLPIGGLLGVLFLVQIFVVIENSLVPHWVHVPLTNAPAILDHLQYLKWNTLTDNCTNIEALGQVLYTVYSLHFILASFVLLVAMIGSIVLTMVKGAYVKRQEVSEQNYRRVYR